MILHSALLCLAMNVYHEARGEDYLGMAAVAIVTTNRADNQQDKVCDEVFKPHQFSWANPLTTVDQATRSKRAKEFLPDMDSQAWVEAKEVARQALTGEIDDIIVKLVGDSEFYFNPNKANPHWAKSFTYVASIGGHDFYSK